MKLPISNRLLSCARLVPKDSKVADVGCDHGYLGIYLLLNQKASFVHAMDLRPMPLNNAKRHGKKYEVDDRMDFHVCHGVSGLQAGDVDTIVCAGMGGDTIISILEPVAWVKDCALILQAQSAGNELRRWLGTQGYAILSETLSEDAGKIYSTLVAKFTGEVWDVPIGQQYVSVQLMECGSPLLNQHLDRVEAGIRRGVDGLKLARGPIDPARLDYYEKALDELLEMREKHG
ncbi:MAG: class I SAM-dependent methyltransferase [Eubacteriales bacterium]